MIKDINPMAGHCRYSSIIYETVIKKCGNVNSILELGCGNGLNLKKFTNVPTKVGIDPLKGNVLAAIENNPLSKILLNSHLYLSNFRDREFDVGITCSVLNHIERFEIALNELIRVCKKLVLIEPMIEGENRQANSSETTGWGETWYFDYRKILTNKGKVFTIEKTPLYIKNSGPLYHTIFVNC